MTVGIPTLKSATGQGLPVKCESVGAGERVVNDTSEHIAYTYGLGVGGTDVGTFTTRYSQSLEAHGKFVNQGLLANLDPPLDFPPKYWFRDMITDEGNVRLRQHELKVYFERLFGVSCMAHVCQCQDFIGIVNRLTVCARRRPGCSP